MKRYIGFLLIMLLVAGGLCSCSEKTLNGVEIEEVDPNVLLNGKDIPVRISFDLTGEKPEAKTKASIVGGVEDTTDYVKNLTMLCFTVEGIYLGYRVATLEEKEGYFTESGHNKCFGRELITGSVPARTSRIHFIANAEDHIPGYDKVGNLESVLMKSSTMITEVSDQRVAYWGFHKENSPTELANWLSVMEIDPITGDTTYRKREGSMVHLIRDRARIEFGDMDDVPDKSGNEYRILQIDWILSNGLTRGFIAPFNANASDHYAGYIDETTLKIDSTRHSPYDLSDAERYTATEESQVMTVYKYEGGVEHKDEYKEASRLFFFEDQNTVANPPKIILRVKYQKHYNRTDAEDQVTKYHTLMLLDPSNQPMILLRNHSYVLNITTMPWEGMGHMTFADAVASTEYENNRTVTIHDKVEDISDGKYELKILEGTSRIYQTGAGTVKTVDFEFLPTDPSDPKTKIDTVTVKGFKVAWDGEVDPSFVEDDLAITSWNSSTGRGTISFTLGTTINAALQSGTMTLQHIKTNLSRKIHIYTISQFNLLPTGATDLTLEATGESRIVSGVSCPTYKLTFRLPGDYPSGLFPLRLRMATTTLNPFKYEVDGDEFTNVGVEMGNTENGTTLDGETLSGMSFVTTTNKWNTRPSGSPWNYWFFFDILSKPLNPDGSEDNRAKTYTIYFDDTRPLRAAANRADQVGLFVKAKYFGPALSAYAD